MTVMHLSDCACPQCHAEGRYDTYCGLHCEHTEQAVDSAFNTLQIWQAQRGDDESEAAWAMERVLKFRVIDAALKADWPHERTDLLEEAARNV